MKSFVTYRGAQMIKGWPAKIRQAQKKMIGDQIGSLAMTAQL
jgi:hypothetical protein